MRCVARAYSLDGGLGLESQSKVIEISDKDEICRPRNKARLAENTFSAQVRLFIFIFFCSFSLFL